MAGSAQVEAMYVTGDDSEVVDLFAHVDARVVVEGLPVREFPVYKGRGSYSGFFWSATMGRHVVYESLLELSWLWLADFDATITRLAAQPLRLQGMDEGRSRTRYPDFLCLTAQDPPLVVDVKRPTAGARPDVRAALAWTERTVEARGWRYQVWTGADPTVLRNVRLIAAGRRAGIGLDGLRDVIEHQDGAPLRFGDVEAMLRGCSAPRLLVLAGLWQGVLRCDMTLPISSDTLVEVA